MVLIMFDLWNGTFANIEEPLLLPPNDDYIQKMREALDEKKMTLVNIAVDGAGLWHNDPEIRKQFYENALAHLKMGEVLGAESVRIDTGTAGEWGTLDMSDEMFEYVVNCFKEFSEIAAKAGFMVGPENHMGPSISAKKLKRIAEAVDHPNFGILVHLGRWPEDEPNGDELVIPYAYHVHVDPWFLKDEERAVEVMRMLKDQGYEGAWGVEYNAKGNQFAETGWVVAHTEKLLAQL